MQRCFGWVAMSVLVGLAGCQRGAEPAADDAAYAERMAKEHAGETPTATPATAERPQLEVTSQVLKYGAVNGRDVNGYLAYPVEAHGALPGVLVFHEWWGLNDNVRAMADQLAGQGYVVLAADLYDGRTAATAEQAQAMMETVLKDKAAVAQNMRVALQFLEEQTQATSIATLGWCLGGGMALETALLAPDKVAATVIFYGHVTTDAARLDKLNMPILGLFGGADDGIPVEHVKQFERTLHTLGKDAEVRIYEGAGHAFANPSGQNYQAGPAADAWQRTLAFLDKNLNKAMYEAPAP
jgi:carboxymethylenebutenolidase